MSNTPCAYAVGSVLHRRVEIKVVSGHCGGELRQGSMVGRTSQFESSIVTKYITNFL